MIAIRILLSTDPANVTNIKYVYNDQDCIEVQIGSDVSLLCEVEGYPTPEVQWYIKNGSKYQSIATADSMMVRVSTKHQHNARYKCVATNYAGNNNHTDELEENVKVRKGV